MKYYLAIDIGASSGRHILGSLQNGKLVTEEIYRFDNNITNQNGSLVWDIESLTKEVKAGICKCKELGKVPYSVAIDTWGVDYVLLDGGKNIISPVYSYRDSRTDGMIEKVEEIVPAEEHYKRCGIQKISFNTVYQLYADKLAGRLENAEYFMMIPAYLSYCLTGTIKNEYTNFTTTAMVNVNTYSRDTHITDALGIKSDIFGEVLMPGDIIGEFTEEMQKLAGFNSKVVFCPSHDTASAVAASPIKGNDVYISSGTWSLIGIENKNPVVTDAARQANFANEGGIEHRFRFLKNYMGMWLLQSIRRALNKSMTYDEMMEAAMNSGAYSYIDVNAREFVAPENMIDAIKTYLGKPDMPLGEVINSVYHSLARSYDNAVKEIEKISGTSAESIHIVGGGSKDKYLNRLTAEYTGKSVTAGPVEATAIGNLISQLAADDNSYTIDSLRELVKKSFDIDEVKI